jgi:hypothetical protein
MYLAILGGVHRGAPSEWPLSTVVSNSAAAADLQDPGDGFRVLWIVATRLGQRSVVYGTWWAVGRP